MSCGCQEADTNSHGKSTLHSMNGPGPWLKRARMRAGFARQQDLADAIGVERSAVANWETDRGKPTMANAERLAQEIKQPRAVVMGKFGYPIGGGEPAADALAALPPEWLTAIRAEIAAGVADGIAQVLEQLRAEGLLPGPDKAAPQQPRRRHS